MKILQINKFLYPKGGAETYLFGLSDLLKKHGQKTIYFSQKNPKNLPSQQKKYFISNLELGRFNLKAIFQIGRMFWSFSAAKKIKRLIAAEKPDIAHIHNIYHQISPSILPILKKAGLPVVMTVHDFKLIRPDYTLRIDGKSSAKSWLEWLILSLEFNLHQALKTYQKNIDIFIAPSWFVKDQLVKNGFKKEKIKIVPHFIDAKNYENNSMNNSNYILFFGRLDKSKGAEDLIRAFADIKNQNTKLKIVGDGPERNHLEKLAEKSGLKERIEFLGRQSQEELKKIIANSLFTVFPSLVHETFGLGILESFACGKPAIAYGVGAFPEIIKDDENGLLIESGNIDKLSTAIDYLTANPQKTREMGEMGKKLVKEKYNPQSHYEQIMSIYDNLAKIR